jgi:hypothetical protein
LTLRIVLSVGLLAAACAAALAMLLIEDVGIGRRDPRGSLLALSIMLSIAGLSVAAATAQSVWSRRHGQEVRGPTRRGLIIDRSGFKDLTSQKRGMVPWHRVARWWVDRDELHVELRYGNAPRVIRLRGLRAPSAEVAAAFEEPAGMPPSR